MFGYSGTAATSSRSTSDGVVSLFPSTSGLSQGCAAKARHLAEVGALIWMPRKCEISKIPLPCPQAYRRDEMPPSTQCCLTRLRTAVKLLIQQHPECFAIAPHVRDRAVGWQRVTPSTLPMLWERLPALRNTSRFGRQDVPRFPDFPDAWERDVSRWEEIAGWDLNR
jgi:hypothetical protein